MFADLRMHIHCGKIVNMFHVASDQLREGDASARESLLNLPLRMWASLANFAGSLFCFGTRLCLALLVEIVCIHHLHVYTATGLTPLGSHE